MGEKENVVPTKDGPTGTTGTPPPTASGAGGAPSPTTPGSGGALIDPPPTSPSGGGGASGTTSKPPAKPVPGTQSGPGAPQPGAHQSPQAGSPGTMAGPLEHVKSQDGNMDDPDGHCRFCGWEIPKGSTVCPHCGMSATDYNKMLDERVANQRAKGMTDAQIQSSYDQDLGQARAAGIQHEFLDQEMQKFTDSLD